MRSASALKKDCSYPNVLAKLNPPNDAQRESMARGTAFHKAIEQWAETGLVPVLEDLEIQGWVDLLLSQWRPSEFRLIEVAWGLDYAGRYVETQETEPDSHVYVAVDGKTPLLTAGRADIAWWIDNAGTLASGDWKTGKYAVTPAADNLQANASGIALAQSMAAKAYRPGIYYARDGYWDWGPVVTLGSPAYAEALAKVTQAALMDDSPRPGPHCDSCWEKRKKTCKFAQATTP